MQKIALAIHGGAGTILKTNMTPQLEAAYKAALQQALQTGYAFLKNGGTAVDAVEAAVVVLEDCPLYNAGCGAVFTADGTHEMDASVMSGRDLSAGAVAAVSLLKNPVKAARAVMETGQHVLLVGEGAEKFAIAQGLATEKKDYFFSQERWDALQRVKAADPNQTELDHGGGNKPGNDKKFGTVGAVALDGQGNLAAATSTGGMTNKQFGRVGDSPLIGAGTYANDWCAVSCTGSGEYFIRLCVAKTLADLMAYKGLSLEQAGNEMIHGQLPAIGGDGGLIAIDRNGNIVLPFNTEGMYRGSIDLEGKMEVSIYQV